MKMIISKSIMTLALSVLAPLAFTAENSSSKMATVAIKNVNVYTATPAGILSDATVVWRDGKIVAINPVTLNADTVVDGRGKLLTPGLIAAMTGLGLTEVDAVSGSDDSEQKEATLMFDPSSAFNPKSTLIPYARKGGISATVVAPYGGEGIFKGQIFVADLSASFDSVRANKTALYAHIGEKDKGSRALDIQTLANVLADALYLQKNPAKEPRKKSAERNQDALMASLLSGKIPLVVAVDRASDMLQLIKLKAKYGIDLVLQDAADAPLIAEQLAAANIAVIINAMNNLPENFSSLNNSLSNAAQLQQAGVMVILQNTNSHNMYQLRFDVGNAVANGLDKASALQTVTANVAKVFGLNSGAIAVGKSADLVLWSGDPLEFSSRVEKLWIGGKEYSTESRQDKLRRRYTTPSELPRAYSQ